MTRTTRILRNIFSNWTGYLITSLVGFALSPFVVHQLGETGYGVWTLVVSLTGYFGLLDLGVRSSVGRFVARNLALGEHESVNRVLSSALAILAGAGAAAFTITMALRFGFGSFAIDAEYQASARLALLIAGLNISIALPAGTFGGLLIAMERFDVLTGISVASALIRAALVVAALKSGQGLVALALIQLLVSLAEYAAMLVCSRALYRHLAPGWKHVDGATCRELLGFGIYRFVWTIANQLIFYTDSIVIATFLNAGAITAYAIASNLMNYGRTVVSLATDTLYPSATQMDSRNDREGLRNLLSVGTTMALSVAVPLCLGFVFLGRPFISLWMGEEYASSAAILLVLTIPQLTSMSQYTSTLILAGMARHRILAYVVLCEAVANIVLSIILVRKMGVIGVAWGTAIPHLVSTGIVIPAYMLRTLGWSAGEYFRQAYIKPLLCGIPVAAFCYWLSIRFENPTWMMFALEAAAVALLYLTMSYFVCLTPGQRMAVSARLGIFLRREPQSSEA